MSINFDDEIFLASNNTSHILCENFYSLRFNYGFLINLRELITRLDYSPRTRDS